MNSASSSHSRIAAALPVAAAALLAGGLLLAVGCGGGGDGGGGGGPTPPQPNQSPTASIDKPSDGNGYAEPDTVFFEGSGSDAEDGSLSGGSLTWESSADGELGSGTSLNSTALSVGDHTIRLIATDSEGAADTVTVSISVIEPGNIAASSGGGQNGKTTREFDDPLVVTLTDAGGNPAAGVEVRWSVADGEEVSLSNSSTRTDDNGEASVTVTSDTLLTSHTVEATSDFFAGGPAAFDLSTTVAWFEINDDLFRDWEGRTNTSFAAQVAVGDTVEWEHLGSSTHSVTSGEGTGGNSGDGVPDGANSFDSPDLQGGDTYRRVFGTAGTYTYYCRFHDDIMYDATLEVTAAAASARGPQRGKLAGSDLEPGDVIAPEGSPFVFVYQGPPGSAGER